MNTSEVDRVLVAALVALVGIKWKDATTRIWARMWPSSCFVYGQTLVD